MAKEIGHMSKGDFRQWGFRRLVLSLILIFSIGIGCQKAEKPQQEPQARITEYINLSFQAKSLADRDSMLNLLTGEAKTRLASWSEDQFRQAFIESKRQFLKLLFRETKAISSTEVMVTYELTFLDKSKGNGTKITQRKIACLVKVAGSWGIKEVQNIKELVEYKNEMSLP
jgi:hypothetical protein